MNRAIDNNKYKNIYIYWGLHFTKIVKPQKQSIDKSLSHLSNHLSNMVDKMMNPDNIREIRKNSFKIAKFVSQVLSEDFKINVEIDDEVKEYIQNNEYEYIEERSDDISSRGIINL